MYQTESARTSARSVALAAVLVIPLVAQLMAVPAAAELPAPPSGEISADRAFVGDPLLGLDPGQAGSLFGRLPDDPDGEASTTKTFTLLLAAEAIESGLLDYDDAVPVSANAQRVNLQHDHGSMNGPAITPGTLFRLEDLLTSMILDSDADATISVAEYVARRTNPGLNAMCIAFPVFCGGSFWESIFVSQMNLRASQLGLSDTRFFNPQGSDHDHDGSGNSTGSVPHETTAREMAKWFDFAMGNPTFRDIIGREGGYAFTPIGSGVGYSASASFGYPGIVGEKGGSNSDCETCRVAMSERAGRPLVVTYMQSDGGDRDPLFDYGFGTTFHPSHRGESSDSLAPPLDHALECVTSTRAASAVATSKGDVEVHLWAVEGGGQSISLIQKPGPGPVVVIDDITQGVGGDPIPIDDFVLDPRSEEEEQQVIAFLASASRRDVATGVGSVLTVEGRDHVFGSAHIPSEWKVSDMDGRTSFGTGSDGRPFLPRDLDVVGVGGDALAVDVVYAGNGHVAAGVVREDVIELVSYGLPVEGEPFFRAKANVGVGTHARVHSPHPGMVLVGYRDAAGILQLQTWVLSGTDGSLHHVASRAGHEVAELRIDGQSSFVNYQLPVPGAIPSIESRFVVATRQADDDVIVRSYRVLVGGAIIPVSSINFGDGTHVRVSRVAGNHPWAEIYAVAYRNASSDAPVVRLYQMGFFGSLAIEGSITVSELEVGPFGRLEIESYRERGVLVASKAHGSNPETRLVGLSVDGDGAGTDDLNLLIDRETDVSGDLLGLCRLPGSLAEGDFLLGESGFFDGRIRLEAWRSAPRQACGLGFEAAVALLPLLIWRRLRCPRR